MTASTLFRSATLHAHDVDAVFQDPRVKKRACEFSVEQGLICGVVLIAVALAIVARMSTRRL